MSVEASRLQSIGVDDKEIPKLQKNKKMMGRIMAAISAAGIPESGCAPAKGNLLVKLCQSSTEKIEIVAQMIGEEKIVTPEQLAASIEFVEANETFTTEELYQNSGVGVVVTENDIVEGVKITIKECLPIIAKKGKNASYGDVMKKVKGATLLMKFAPSKDVANEVKKQIAELPDKIEIIEEKKEEVAGEAIDFRGIVAAFKTPADNEMNNPPDVQEDHMKKTDGCYMTRFPPEPNGWIHIGHAKAMLLDFGLAEVKGGKCYMRFDDTNPAKEKDEFIEGIKKDVKWMGFNWWKLTHTSDYFQELYDFALQLIDNGLAYVCHQTKAEITEYREKLIPSPWRDRDPKESRRLFELMKIGYFEPSEATLRLKMDYKHENPNMRDQIAYRIIYKEHPRTADQWCIYPTYDYSHCVIDSIEHVTHSLCTLEFESRRDSYYWVLDALRIYKPIVWEFNRLNITHTIMSKRRLQTLVVNNFVDGWDDPRMPTIAGLRRRGFTPSAIRQFCQEVGYTRNVTTIIQVGKLESIQKAELDETSPRAFCVINPLKITITNLSEEKVIEAPLFPRKPAAGNRTFKLTPTIYIEREDFEENPPKDYKRLSPSLAVGLKYANIVIKVVEIIKNGDSITELKCEVVPSAQASAFIHWVSTEAKPAEVRIYDDLFLTPDLSKLEGDWKDDLNPKSLVPIKGALCEPYLGNAKDLDRFQFERIGYFVCDKDSTPEMLVFNRTLPLVPRPNETK